MCVLYRLNLKKFTTIRNSLYSQPPDCPGKLLDWTGIFQFILNRKLPASLRTVNEAAD